MRGADEKHAHRSQQLSRFIPTCVGQMQSQRCRMSGAIGSSPHAWGRWPRTTTGMVSISVHPHMRGADFARPLCIRQKKPVHPHMRGADSFHVFNFAGFPRFIPTCVGQIVADYRPGHPHTGSSPHAWGRFLLSWYIVQISAVHPHMRGADWCYNYVT